jgi:hypothetical protein
LSDIITPWVIRFAASARKHRVSQARARYVIGHCGLVFNDEPPPDASVFDDRLLFLGDDGQGVPLEVMALELDDGELLVIHAMKRRPRYETQYIEALACRVVP